MNIKLIALDLDGTLLRSDKTVSDYTINILKQCRERGNKVIYVTMRGATTLPFDTEGLFDGYIKNGGALAYDGDELVYLRTNTIDELRPTLLACSAAGIRTAVQNHYEKMHYANFDVASVWSYNDYSKIVNFADIDFDIVKTYVLADTDEDKKIIAAHMPENTHIFLCRDGLTFVYHKDAIKSKATMALAQRWGIKREEIVAFGDDMIDVEFLQKLGIGVAMGNAIDQVKAIADQICDTNDNDGVAKWIEANVLGGEKC